MKKIPRVFKMDPDDRGRVLNEVTPDCEWVLAGEGAATRKYDGTSCLIRGGVLYKRYDAKNGKTPPAGWEACEAAADPETGHWPGWLRVSDTAPEDWMHREVAKGTVGFDLSAYADGTYELCGPKVGQNPEKLERYELIKHGQNIVEVVDRSLSALKALLEGVTYEGLVFHHGDGRMAKIRRKDFGLKYPL